MSTIRNATRFRLINTLMGVGFGLAFISGGVYLSWEIQENFGNIMLIFLYVIVSGLIVGGIITLRYQTFTCPQCGGKVELVNEGIEGDPIMKTCKACDTVWRIGSV